MEAFRETKNVLDVNGHTPAATASSMWCQI